MRNLKAKNIVKKTELFVFKVIQSEAFSSENEQKLQSIDWVALCKIKNFETKTFKILVLTNTFIS